MLFLEAEAPKGRRGDILTICKVTLLAIHVFMSHRVLAIDSNFYDRHLNFFAINPTQLKSVKSGLERALQK